jgi:hypothetical protein
MLTSTQRHPSRHSTRIELGQARARAFGELGRGSRDVGTRFGVQGSEQQHCRLAAHSLVVLTLSPSATTLAL